MARFGEHFGRLVWAECAAERGRAAVAVLLDRYAVDVCAKLIWVYTRQTGCPVFSMGQDFRLEATLENVQRHFS